MDTTDIMIPAWVNGTLTPVEKFSVHRDGLRHPAVSVFVIRDSAILLQRRALDKYHTPGLWANTCCTHPFWQEPPLACAHRRLKEELGISALDLRHRGQLEYRADVGKHLIEHEVVEVFSAQATKDMHITPNADEVMDTRWVTPDTLAAEITDHPEHFTPWLRIYMSDYVDMILGAD
ncbi:MAG: isopentenyl-diphosphate Delta-isomerase [Sulfitobacter sp.]